MKNPCKNCLVLPCCLGRYYDCQKQGWSEIVAAGGVAHHCELLRKYLYDADNFNLYSERTDGIVNLFNNAVR